MQLPVSTIDDSGRQSRILVPSRIGIILHESFKQLVSAIKIAIIDVLPHMKSIREVQDLKDIRYLQADTRELYTLYANQDVLSFYYQKYSTKDEMCQALKDDYDKLLNQILYVSRIVNKTISENAGTEVDQDQLTQKHNEIRDGMLFVASCAWEWLQANINEHFNQIPAFSINPSYKR